MHSEIWLKVSSVRMKGNAQRPAQTRAEGHANTELKLVVGGSLIQFS
jgi:hypothetical protein